MSGTISVKGKGLIKGDKVTLNVIGTVIDDGLVEVRTVTVIKKPKKSVHQRMQDNNEARMIELMPKMETRV